MRSSSSFVQALRAGVGGCHGRRNYYVRIRRKPLHKEASYE